MLIYRNDSQCHHRGYFDASSCSGGGSSAVFTLASPSNCVSTGGVYPKYTYEKWTACNYGYITVSEYTGDLYCENLVLTSTKSVSCTVTCQICYQIVCSQRSFPHCYFSLLIFEFV